MAQQQPMDYLRATLQQTLLPDANIRMAAERQLTELSKQPGHPLTCLHLITQCNAPQDMPIRQAAAVLFKNLVKNHWDEDHDTGVKIPENERQLIKAHLVDLMCTVPSAIQMQCSEAIALIAAVDFPNRWENLMPDLISKFNVDGDLDVVNGVLLTAASIIKPFRYSERSDALYSDIAYVLKHLQGPLLKLFKIMRKSVEQQQGDVALLNKKLKALRTMNRIFFSLNWQDLPEYFEDHIKEWMEEFAFFLKYENAALVDPDEELESSSLDCLQAAIVDNLNLYANKDEEPFLPHLPTFTTIVWNLLMKTTHLPKHDVLAVTCIRFLASLVGKQMHVKLFENEATLREIIGKIVVPNLKIREADEEKFEDDPADFILSDMEGSDTDSRRKCAQELLRSMCRFFEDQTTAICSEHINAMLNEYNSDKTNKWGCKDVAIHLVLAISIRAESASHGVSQVNEKVNVMDFFMTNIVTELQQQNSDHAMLTAAAIKYASTFRNQFSTQNLGALMPLLISHLSSSNVVVHTYAAAAIEKVLITKKAIEGTKELKFGREQVKPILESLFTGLFSIVDNENLSENEYVMKAVMRSLSVAKEDLVAVTQIVLEKLTASLGRVAKNPRNPHFNHYLFESIAVLVRSVCSKNPEYTGAFEALLFPPFQIVLSMDVLEFTPYVFQVLAQMLEYRSDGLSEAYSSLFPPLLTPTLWERKGNVPGLTRLIQAYLHKGGSQIVQQGHLIAILGVFQKLIASKANEANGFALLESITLYVPKEATQGNLKDIFQILLIRLQANKGSRYKRLVTNFFALFIGKFGAQAWLDQMNGLQAGLGFQIMMNVWLPYLMDNAPATRIDAKIQVVGLTKLICETPALLADSAGQQIWTRVLACIMKSMTSVGLEAKDGEEEEFAIDVSYDATYSKLHFAATPVADPFCDVSDVSLLLARSLHTLCQSQPGKFPPLIQQGLQSDEKLMANFSSLMQKSGLGLS